MDYYSQIINQTNKRVNDIYMVILSAKPLYILKVNIYAENNVIAIFHCFLI